MKENLVKTEIFQLQINGVFKALCINVPDVNKKVFKALKTRSIPYQKCPRKTTLLVL